MKVGWVPLDCRIDGRDCLCKKRRFNLMAGVENEDIVFRRNGSGRDQNSGKFSAVLSWENKRV